MPMREDCKNFQSRTYRSGEVARWCVLDLAPEAPWRCPDDCPGYERRLADAAWSYGSLLAPPVPDEPPGLDRHDHAAALLDEAEDIINTAGPEIVAEVSEQRARTRAAGRWWARVRGRWRRPR
jgi:hypothetical protein